MSKRFGSGEVTRAGIEVVPGDAPVRDAAAKMKQLDVGAIPVCDGQKLTGVLTDRDIVIRAIAAARDMEDRSDVEQPRKTTGISERELAELIQSGDREQITSAMPRMTPEMRRIAEAVISGDFVAR